MNNKNNKMELFSDIVLYIFVIALIAFIAYYITKSMKVEEVVTPVKTTITPPLQGDGSNMLPCPYGCQRGRCIHKGSPHNKKNHMCSFDFQCEKCNDRKTGNFYVDGDYEYEKIIQPKYANVTEPEEIEILNKEIANNNNYINELNQTIMKMNHDNSFTHNPTRFIH